MAMSISKYTAGVDTMDIVGGAVGLAGATLLPKYIYKGSSKWVNVAIAAAVTLGLGYAAKKFMPSAAKAVVIGGLAGTASQAIFNLTGTSIGQARSYTALPARNYPNANATSISQTTKPEFSGLPTL